MDEKSSEHFANDDIFRWNPAYSLVKPDNFTEPEELYQCLIARIREYHPSSDITMVEKAYAVAKKAHEGQLRKSGEPYIIHPLCVGSF